MDGHPPLPSPLPSQTICENPVCPTVHIHIPPAHPTFYVLEPTERQILFDASLSKAYLDTTCLVQPQHGRCHLLHARRMAKVVSWLPSIRRHLQKFQRVYGDFLNNVRYFTSKAYYRRLPFPTCHGRMYSKRMTRYGLANVKRCKDRFWEGSFSYRSSLRFTFCACFLSFPQLELHWAWVPNFHWNSMGWPCTILIGSTDGLCRTSQQTRMSCGDAKVTFKACELTICAIDMSGQKNERGKWIHCSENMTSPVFLLSWTE